MMAPALAVIVALMAQPAAPPPAALPVPELPAAMGRSISAERLSADVATLASFGTRHTLSAEQDPRRGIGAARQWIFDQFVAVGCKAVAFDAHTVPKGPRLPDGATVVNVMAVVGGTDPAQTDRLYYVVGHYDSRNADAMDAVREAPGANDNASGAALVLELARAVAAHPLPATVVFLATAGEEQGLVGARRHAEEAASKGAKILAVLNSDIVGDPSPRGGDRAVVRVFSEALPKTLGVEALAALRAAGAETDGPSRQLARFVDDVARLHSMDVRARVVYRADRFLRGGDHSAFNDNGFAAVRFTASAEDYSRQHANVTERDGRPYGDVPAFVDGAYLAGVARLNLATLVHLASAPGAPERVRLVADALGNDTTLRWAAVPGADGYEVVWRETTDWRWTHAADAGNATSLTLPLSKDDLFFGVRSYTRAGYRSPVVFAGAGRQ